MTRASTRRGRPPAADQPGTPAPAPDLPGIPVRDILELPAMRGSRVLAGAGGLDRVIRFVNIMEVPDVLRWTKADELLLTTGYPLRSTPEALDDFVAALDQRGLAGLAVKIGRYLDRLPDIMLTSADRLDFPVVQIPDNVGFDEIINQILTEVLGRQAALLARSEQAHTVLLQLVLRGGGLPEVVAALPDLVGPPMSGSPSRAEPSSVGGPGSVGGAPVSVFHVERTGRVVASAGAPLPTVADELFDADGLFRSAAFRHGVYALSGRPRPPAPTGSRAGVAAPPVASPAPVQPASVEPVPAAASMASVLVATVVAERNQGSLVAVRTDRDWDVQDAMILERGATVAALVVTRELAVAAVEGKYRGDFLRDVLAGRIAPDAAVAGAQGFGWDLTGPLVVVVAATGEPRGADEPARRRRAEQLGASWAAWVRRWDPLAAAAAFATEAVAVLHRPDGSVPGSARVAELLGGLSSPGTPFDGIVGVSRVVSGASALAAAYGQAWEAVRVGRRLSGAGSVSRFDDLGLYRLLSMVPDSAELRSFLADTLGPLAAPQGDVESDELRRTLAVLLETNLNVAQTARRLHFHYNTLRYRIGKLERLLGPFATDARLRADLVVALAVWQMRVAHR
jgi:purine catabolism regulator